MFEVFDHLQYMQGSDFEAKIGSATTPMVAFVLKLAIFL
tara:strand:+ start:11 stop:127 length:117 start_codon:yes stop_codon:yes gene_type:complete